MERREQWRGIRAEIVRRTHLSRQDIHVSGDMHALFLNLEGAARAGENFLDGVRTGFVARPQGSLAYIPPGRTWSGWDEGDDTAAYLFLAIDREFAGGFFDDPRAANALKPELGFHDLSIQFAARRIAGELSRIDDASGLIVESCLATIFGHLSKRINQAGRPFKGGLAPAVLNRVLGRLGTVAEERLTLTGLCQDLGMSTSHFSRAFKQSTGTTPHAYFNSRRLDHASTLLRTTSHSVTEIAFMCGFASASHLSTTFRQALAVPPRIYRDVWGKTFET